MKYASTLTVFVCFILFSCSISAQLTWLNPRPSGASGLKIVFRDALNGLLLNGSGDLFYTSDQGTTWNLQKNFPFATTMDINTASATGVICTSYDLIYVSADNGISWQPKYTGFTGGITMARVVSRDTFFLANSTGKIYRSDDRGDTWKVFNCNNQISSIEFINSKTGYAGCSNYLLLKTTDGGVTWQQNLSSNVVPSGTNLIKFFDENTGYAVRGFSEILSTKDGGKNWSSFGAGDLIFSIYFIDKNTAYGCGEYGMIYRTNNGGVTWEIINPGPRIFAYDLNSICFVDNNTGFATGSRGRILKTTDAGTTWNAYSPSYNSVYDISFPTKNNGYASIGRTIYKTSDAGNSWDSAYFLPGSTASTDYCQKLFFFSKDTGIGAVNGEGRVLKTFDGGHNWKVITAAPYPFTADDATDLQFLDNKTGFMARNDYHSSMIMKTTDQGETWAVAWGERYNNQVFTKIFFNDEKTGYGSRQGGLYKTTDSLKNWSLLFNDEYQTITAIWFVNRKTGYVGENNGVLKKTNDSGKTWVQLTVANLYNYDISSVKFIDENIGFMTAQYGGAYKTIDGGIMWTRLTASTPYDATFGVIKFGVDSTLFLGGGYGAILSSSICELNHPLINTPVTYCLHEAAMSLTATGNNLTWYDTSSGGIPNFMAPIPNTAITGSQSYWVTSTSADGCESERARIDILIADSTGNISLVNLTQTGSIADTTIFSKACDGLIATVEPNGGNPVNGNISASVWVDPLPFGGYVSRHYEITPQNNTGTATAQLTLYFTQGEFDAFNLANPAKLPTGPNDAAGIARLLVEKRSGTSSDRTGLPATYPGQAITIDPEDTAVVWNQGANRWEINFNVTGFSGFFVKTALSALAIRWLSVSGNTNTTQHAVINWKVEEFDVYSYELEKSFDGIHFQNVGSVKSKGDGINTYSYTESASLVSSSYYRIKQIDKDGHFTRSATLKLSPHKAVGITLFPNPFTTTITINTDEQLMHSLVSINDISGRVIKQVRLNAQSTVLDLNILKTGVYLIKFEDGTIEKVVKQ